MKAIAYIRVSTQRQGQSGLGLEAQIAAIADWVSTSGAELVETYEEVESGKNNERPQLAKALAHARKTKATLVIAKLDRLSRDAHFLLGLQKAGVPFVACDMPHADNFTVGILALVAQKEREMISQRTKAALAAAKARGIRLGSPEGIDTSHIARAARSVKASAKAKNIAAVISDIERSGISTLAGVAQALQARGIKTPRGNDNWTATQVARVQQRLHQERFSWT